MRVGIGSDHAGFLLKEELKALLVELGHEVRDFGTNSLDPVDYPDFIVPTAEAVAAGQCDRGIVLGGSGNGEAMAANKVPGIRCSLCWESYTARVARQHNDANVLSLGARVIGVDLDDAKLATARKAGAAYTINTASEDLHEKLEELNDGYGPDVVIEAIGSRQTFRAAVDEVAFGGRVVYIGYAKEEVAYETRLFVLKELDILGSRNALPEDFHDVIRMLEAYRFPVEDAVTHTVPMEEAPRILEAWNHEPTRFGKIMIEVS